MLVVFIWMTAIAAKSSLSLVVIRDSMSTNKYDYSIGQSLSWNVHRCNNYIYHHNKYEGVLLILRQQVSHNESYHAMIMFFRYVY